MKTAIRFVILLLYTGYLVHVGLLMLIVPWSNAWPRILFLLPPAWAGVLDNPALRGAVSAFGLLHLVLVVIELAFPAVVRRR